MAMITAIELERELCQLLGIDPNVTRAIEVHLVAGDVLRLVVHQTGVTQQGEALRRIFRDARFVETTPEAAALGRLRQEAVTLRAFIGTELEGEVLSDIAIRSLHRHLDTMLRIVDRARAVEV